MTGLKKIKLKWRVPAREPAVHHGPSRSATATDSRRIKELKPAFLSLPSTARADASFGYGPTITR